MINTVETTAVSAVYGADNVNETIDNEAAFINKQNNDLNNLNGKHFRDLNKISVQDGILDTDKETILTEEIISRYYKEETSPYWKGFDLYHANRYQMKEYILERAMFNPNAEVPNRMHYLIYMIYNKINGKFYIGQHQTEDLNDRYMGSGYAIKIAEDKYGIENFEKIIIYDFDNWDEMNHMEELIVTNIFRRKWDEVYNRAVGGFDGNTSAKQIEAFKNGEVKSAVKGKVAYHTKDGVTVYIDKDEENIPEGLEKGIGMKGRQKKRHDAKINKMNELLLELHNLGDDYNPNLQHTSINMLEHRIKQIKKYKEKEEEHVSQLHEAFDFLKTHTQEEMMRKFRRIRNLSNYYELFDRLFHEEWVEYNKNIEIENKRREDEYNRMKQELIDFGFDRQWKTYTYELMKKMYERFLKGKQHIDELVQKYLVIFEDYKKLGMVKTQEKYGIKHVQNFFRKYIPKEYSEYHYSKYGEYPNVRENIYQSLISGVRGKNDENGHYIWSEESLAKKKAMHDERVRLYNEIWELGSKKSYNERTALTTLRDILENLKIKKERIENKKKELQAMYDEIHDNGYESMCEKFNYHGGRQALHKQMKKYLDNFSKIKLYENLKEYVRLKHITLNY